VTSDIAGAAGDKHGHELNPKDARKAISARLSLCFSCFDEECSGKRLILVNVATPQPDMCRGIDNMVAKL
jgi:hypothetical protein